MSDKPKPLTKAEWECTKALWAGPGADLGEMDRRINATLDALFAYRERTQGFYSDDHMVESDDIAAELGIE